MGNNAEQIGSLILEVPIDASEVGDFDSKMPIKVALVDGRDAVLTSCIVKLSGDGHGRASLKLDTKPAGARVVVGPGDALDEDLVRLQTIQRSLSARTLQGGRLDLTPIRISSFYWRWWLRWCRTFVIRGKIVCADGSPVPGATVCAYDVDWWWWWSSSQQIGCATTDASGAFALKFRWCCGWWPWWWWRLRHWQLEPRLVERIKPLFDWQPGLKLPKPSPRPSLEIFEALIAEDGIATRHAPSQDVDLARLPVLRDALLKRLPAALDLEQLRIWPWWPWHPWRDCAPDLIFKVKQTCGGEERLIVDEDIFDVRWNIPTELDVILTANSDACCVQDNPTPEGNCMVISSVCSNQVNMIGGNAGAAAVPAGYLSPGIVATGGDRPFAAALPIAGLFGNGANVDYYEVQWATMPSGPWNTMPPAAAGGFSRWFWGPALPAGAVDFHHVPFDWQVIGGRLVIESREHFEAVNDPGSWGWTRFWTSNRDLLLQWLTASTFADGTYYLRLVGYELTAADTLGPPQILPLCNTTDDNGLVLAIDNATGDLEPAADIIDVRINGVSAGPCSNIDAREGGSLEVDFVAYDEDRHLAYYSLIATYGKNSWVSLLGTAGATLTPLPLGAVPAADFVGPSYGAARMQGAPAPHWRAGGLRLSIPDLHAAFPETCCYQLELRVYKRTVVSCNHNFTPNKLSFYSLTVVV